MTELIVQGILAVIRGLRAGVKAGNIKPEDLEALEAEMDGLKADRKAAKARWDAAGPGGG